MTIETVLDDARERLSAIEELRQRSGQTVEARRLRRLQAAKEGRRQQMRHQRRVRRAADIVYAGVENLCALGGSPEVQALIRETGPITIWGWHLPELKWSCYIRIELDRLAIVESAESKDRLAIFYDYSITDTSIRALGKRRLWQIAGSYYPFDEEDWAMVDHEYGKFGYVQQVDPVLLQVLADCGTPDGLMGWFQKTYRT